MKFNFQCLHDYSIHITRVICREEHWHGEWKNSKMEDGSFSMLRWDFNVGSTIIFRYPADILTGTCYMRCSVGEKILVDIRAHPSWHRVSKQTCLEDKQNLGRLIWLMVTLEAPQLIQYLRTFHHFEETVRFSQAKPLRTYSAGE